ncbi:unnamed protein product, partial [Musa acuminata subsp. burmannicoides]
MQIQTPKTIRAVPKKVRPTRISSPRIIAATAVAANVVAFVTGTATEMGAPPSMWKKAAEADRLIRKGTEYCHVRRRSIHLRTWPRRRPRGRWPGVRDRSWSFRSQTRAPRRMTALVAPHTIPTAIIFSTSPAIFFRPSHHHHHHPPPSTIG